MRTRREIKYPTFRDVLQLLSLRLPPDLIILKMTTVTTVGR